MKPSETLLLATLAVFSAVLLRFSLDMPYAAAQAFGPGFVPLNLSVATLVLTAAIAGRRLITRRHDSTEAGQGPTAAPPEKPASTGHRAVLAAMVLLGIAVSAMHIGGGVLLPLTLLVWVVSWRLSGHGPVLSAGVAGAVTVCIYVVFNLWLNIPLT